MRAATAAGLVAAGLDPVAVADVARRALAEDLGAEGDLTTAATVPAALWSTGEYRTRQRGVAAGLPVLAAVLEVHLGDDVAVTAGVSDGEVVEPGAVLATVTASTRGLLEVERTSLNLLGHLAGIATATRRWVDALAGTGTRVRDTRKTTPGLRALEKYAVRCGGGSNHRAGLYDAVLVKDNHVLAAGGVGAAVDAVRARYRDRPGLVVQVEVDTLAQLDEALAHGATEVLLDNMDLDTLAAAVRRTRSRAPGVVLEASGSLTLDSVAAVAATGVDLVAVGALTHSAPAVDIGLDLRAEVDAPPSPHDRVDRRVGGEAGGVELVDLTLRQADDGAEHLPGVLAEGG